MRKYLFFLIALLAASLVLTGCESDSTAPNEDLPELSAEDVAAQSGAMASAMIEVLPRIWDPETSKDNGEYEYTWTTGQVIGTVFSEFRTVEGGELIDYGEAGWGWVYTGAEAPLTITLIEGGVPWFLGFSITADIDQDNDTALANGSGTLEVGDYLAEFTLVGVVVEDGEDYPAAGIINFTTEGVLAVVTFDGDNMVTVMVGGESYTIDLDEGTIS